MILSAALLMAQGAVAAQPDFDQGRIDIPAMTVPAPSVRRETLWVTMDPEEALAVGASGVLPEALTAFDLSHGLYRVSEDRLPDLSAYMHDTFGRCGGFFTYRTRAEAEAGVSASKSVLESGPYTIDQKAVVVPLVAKVKESEIRATIETLSNFKNRYYGSDSGIEAATLIKGRWQALAAKFPGATAQLVKQQGWRQPSVILTIPGAEKPEEIVVLGGHIDSINTQDKGPAAPAPGADDNASGIAVLTEALRILGESGLRPRRTIQFMGYAAEEIGLRGSQDIAQQAAKEGRKVVAVIQYDMTNFRGAGDSIYLISDFVDPKLMSFLGTLIDNYAGVPWATTKCGYACSDHASWTRNGYPAAAAFEATFEGKNHALHTIKDTLSTTGGTAKHSVPFAKLAVAFAVEVAKP
jgi:leucyl aminopeptidase